MVWQLGAKHVNHMIIDKFLKLQKRALRITFFFAISYCSTESNNYLSLSDCGRGSGQEGSQMAYAFLIIGQNQKATTSVRIWQQNRIPLLIFLFCCCMQTTLVHQLNAWFLNEHCNKKRTVSSALKSVYLSTLDLT